MRDKGCYAGHSGPEYCLNVLDNPLQTNLPVQQLYIFIKSVTLSTVTVCPEGRKDIQGHWLPVPHVLAIVNTHNPSHAAKVIQFGKWFVHLSHQSNSMALNKSKKALKERYIFGIFDIESHKQVINIKFSLINLIFGNYGCVAGFDHLIAVVLVFIYTPLRELIPGYPNAKKQGK